MNTYRMKYYCECGFITDKCNFPHCANGHGKEDPKPTLSDRIEELEEKVIELDERLSKYDEWSRR